MKNSEMDTLIADPRPLAIRSARRVYFLLFFLFPICIGLLLLIGSPNGVSPETRNGAYIASHLLDALLTLWFARRLGVSALGSAAYFLTAAIPLPLLSWVVLFSLWRRSQALITAGDIPRSRSASKPRGDVPVGKGVVAKLLANPRKAVAWLLVWTTINAAVWIFCGGHIRGWWFPFQYSDYSGFDVMSLDEYGLPSFFIYVIVPWVAYAVLFLLGEKKN